MNENAKAWVKALRSGEFDQTQGRLFRPYADSDEERCYPAGHCCLGVGSELYRRAHPERCEWDEDGEFRHTDGNGYDTYSSYEGTLAREVRVWLGLRDRDGAFDADFEVDGNTPTTLASANDAGANFHDIAEFIESEPEGLFE